MEEDAVVQGTADEALHSKQYDVPLRPCACRA